MTGKGVSGVGEDESLGRVDSAVAGIDPVVFGMTVELGGAVAVKKLQAMDTDKIASNASILVDFIISPDKLVSSLYFFSFKKKTLVPSGARVS